MPTPSWRTSAPSPQTYRICSDAIWDNKPWLPAQVSNVIEFGGKVIGRQQIADLHTTEFRMMLTLMVQLMDEIPEASNIVFLTNAAYIQNFDREPGPKSANPDLIRQCIESKKRHSSVSVKIVPYHKSPLLIETHDTSTEAMKEIRLTFSS